MARITKEFVKKLVTEKPVARIVWDDAERGFCVRQTEAGTITYVLSYYFDGKNHRYTIGKHPEITADNARDEAKALRTKIKGSEEFHIAPVDPLEERKAKSEERINAPTFGDLTTAFLKDAKTRTRESSFYDYERMLGVLGVNEDGTPKKDKDEKQRERRILTVLGDKRLAEIKPSDIVRFHEALRPTPYLANRALGLIKAIFNYGIKNEWTTANPAHGVKRFYEEKREAFLTIEQFQRLREAIEGYSDASARNALLLLMLTGSREGEVLKAEWEQFDLTRGVWTKPFTNTKQKRVEHIPLSSAARALLESMQTPSAIGPLFPGVKRKGKGGKITGGDKRVSLARPWRQVRKAAGLVEESTTQGKRPLRIHDLRHNFASHLASNGVSLQVIGKLLGHSQIATTQRYSHLQDAALRDATGVFSTIYEGTKKTGTDK